MSLKKTLIRDTMLYSAANYLAMAIGIGLSIAMKAVLGAAGAGYWAVLKVVTSYGEYSDMGMRDALLRELPQASGAGDAPRAKAAQDHAFSFSLLASLAAALVIFIISFFVKDPTLQKGFWIAAGLVVATHVYNFFLTLLRTLKKVPELSLLIVVNMLFVTVCALSGAWTGGVLGLAAGFLVSTAVSGFVAWKLSRTSIGLGVDPLEVKRLLAVGIPMAALSYCLVTFVSLDTMMIGKTLGIEALGFYTIALMAVQQVSTLGRFAHIIVFPHIQERAGQAGSVSAVKPIFVRGTQVLAHVLPLVIALGFFVIPALVHYILPRFEQGVPAMKILLTGYFFMAVNEMSSTVLFTADKHRSLIPLYAVMIAVAAALLAVFMHRDPRIESAALAMAVSYFLFFSIVFYRSFREILTGSELSSLFFGILAVFAYFALLAWTIDRFVHVSAPFWAECLLKLVIFTAAYMPAFLPIERREGLFAGAWSTFQFKKEGKAHG